MVNQPLLSVIITSYTTERLKDIFEVLDSLKNQTYLNIEIVFVAESSMELYERVKAYSWEKGLSNLRLVFSREKIGISEARNVGARCARGDLIAFTDDDAVLFPNWAGEVAKTFAQHNDLIGVTGPVLPLWENESLRWFPEEFYWIIGCTAWKDLNNLCESDYACGVNMAFRKEAFGLTSFKNRYTKGAHKEGKLGPVGDDIDFSYSVKRKTGKRILYNPNVKVLHKVSSYKLTSKFIRRYSYWQGYSDALFKHISGATNERLRTEFGLLNRIISNLLPIMARELITNCSLSLKKIKVSLSVLLYFALGYFSYIIPKLATITRKAV